MNTSAIYIFLLAQITVVGFTCYFFYKVLASQSGTDKSHDAPKTFDAT
jgi:hypothetical protein